MPKLKSPLRGVAHEIFLQHNGIIPSRRIAERLVARFGGEVSKIEQKIAVWKKRDSWLANVVQQSNANDVQHKKQRSASFTERCTTNAPIPDTGTDYEVSDVLNGAQRSEKDFFSKTNAPHPNARPGNKNAVGHGAPRGNKNAFVHGQYAERNGIKFLGRKIILSGETAEEVVEWLQQAFTSRTIPT